MKLSVSVDIMFGKWGVPMSTEDFLKHLETVKKAGYEGIEILNWEQFDLDQVKAKKDELGLEVVNLFSKCERMGEAALKETFLQDLRKTIEAAHKLGCKNLFTSAGHARMFLSEQTFWANMIDAMKEARKVLDGEGVTLLMEPVNVKVDHAGVFPMNAQETFMLMQILDDPNIKVLFDLYHQQITDGNLVETIRHNISRIGHFHAAGVPGRNELKDSEVDFPFVIKEIEKLGYDGYLGMEYDATMDIYESLVQSRDYLLK